MRPRRPLSVCAPARAAIAPYWQVARRSCQRSATYRAATFAGIFTNTVFAFLRVFVLLAVFRHRDRVGPFDATDVVTFTFVGEGLMVTVGAHGGLNLANRIRTGDVVTDLYRPLHFLGYWLAEDLGRAGFDLVARALVPVLAGALFLSLRLPDQPVVWLMFLVSVVLAVLLSFAFRFVVILSGFWLLDVRGPWQLATFAMQFFAGFIVPLTFFPDGLEQLARVLPFAAMAQLPIELFLGKHDGMGMLGVVAQQVLWAAVLLGLAELVAGRAFRRVVVQGG